MADKLTREAVFEAIKSFSSDEKEAVRKILGTGDAGGGGAASGLGVAKEQTDALIESTIKLNQHRERLARHFNDTRKAREAAAKQYNNI